MKKIVSILLLVVMLLTVCSSLASCKGQDDGKLHIKFYHTMGENLRKVLNQYVKEFEALYPEYKIDHEQIGGYEDVRDQIATEITANKQPNIAYCYPDHVALYNLALAVKTLDGYIDSDEVITRADGSTEILGLTEEQKADFIQAYYEEGKQFGDGLMYTMPLSKSTEVLYYNKTYFEVAQKMFTSDVALDLNGEPVKNANGETIPNPNKGNDMYNLFVPQTWEEMELICERIVGIENDRLPADKKAAAAKVETSEHGYKIYFDKEGKKLAQVIPLGYDSESNWFITMCEQMGLPYTSSEGEKFLFNTDAHHEFVSEFRDWYLKGYVTTQEIHGSYTSSLFTAKTGTKSYMSIGSSAGATHQRPAAGADDKYPFEVGITPIPQYNAENPKVISQGPSLCIFEASEEEMKASWLFVKFLCTNVAFQADFSRESGYVPVIKSVNTDPIYADFLANADGGDNIAALSVKVCLEQEQYYYTSPAFNSSAKARDEVGKLIQSVFKLSPETANVPDAIKKLFDKAVAECKYHAQ
ncbi:MAG: extracellular solute-binding protein [Ruminococcaceae bacterium]|nr:extracellular solute-binding protein [Oscillospiraceae bacterium]